MSTLNHEASALVFHLLNVLAKLDHNLLGLVTEGAITVASDAVAHMPEQLRVMAPCASFIESIAGKCKVRCQGLVCH